MSTAELTNLGAVSSDDATTKTYPLLTNGLSWKPILLMGIAVAG